MTKTTTHTPQSTGKAFEIYAITAQSGRELVTSEDDPKKAGILAGYVSAFGAAEIMEDGKRVARYEQCGRVEI